MTYANQKAKQPLVGAFSGHCETSRKFVDSSSEGTYICVAPLIVSESVGPRCGGSIRHLDDNLYHIQKVHF